MGFFQDISGKTAADAARDARNSLDQSKTQALSYLDAGYGTGTNAINTNYNQARDQLFSGWNTAQNAANPAYSNAQGYLDNGASGATGRLDTALSGATGAYQPLSDLGTKYGGATTLALNALGVNGQGGTDAARSAFTTSPGYSFNLDQGLEAINRARAASGQLASGNTDRANQNYGAGLASQEYDKWLNNLLGFTSPELSATSGAASGIANANTTLGVAGANILNQQGTNKAALEQSRGNLLANLANNYGTNAANTYTQEGNTLANLASTSAGQKANVVTSIAQPYANTFGQEAAAWGQGSGNLLNLGMNTAKFVAGGGLSGLGSLGSSAGTIGGTGGGLGGLY